MTVIQFPTRAASFEPVPKERSRPHAGGLMSLLSPSGAEVELPPLSELVHALLDLAAGTRRKVLVPLVGQPLEVALLRRGASALVSIYHTDASPSVLVLDRRVPLRALLDASALALAEALAQGSELERASAERLLSRAEAAELVELDDDGRAASRVRGGALEDPGAERPLAFGFEAAIFGGAGQDTLGLSHADVHAMLFGGQLWGWVRGRKIPLFKGPILLAAQRMLAACSGFVEARREGRAPHVRQRVGGFVVALRGEPEGRVQVALGASEDGVVTVPSLEVPTAVRAILRLTSELLRALCATDKSQTRNLRVRALRAEVRRISRAMRELKRAGSFENRDPDRLRPSTTLAGDVSAPEPGEPVNARSIGWSTRWSVALGSLDAESSALTEGLFVASTEDALVVLDKERGDALWRAESRSVLTLTTPLGILSVTDEGVAVLRDVHSGDVLFETPLELKERKVTSGFVAAGPEMPPTAILIEGRGALTALDLRTGALRFRFVQAGSVPLKVERDGRVLVVVGADGTISALDAATGALAWRFADDVHALSAPVIARGRVFVVSGEAERGAHELVALDLYRGTPEFRVEVEGPASLLEAVGSRLLVVSTEGDQKVLTAFDVSTGASLWSRSDPGFALGAGHLEDGDRLFVNAPTGRLTAVDLRTGRTDWQRVLSAAETDDVPRCLDPIAGAGVLFVPSGTIHVLRPEDGSSVGGRSRDGVPSDLVADFFRIDREGWMYVGEESGHVVALAPQRRLTLVRPG